ncbi:hypothetical protein AB0H34_38655 [Saccharopolyspora shandongensis]|uniref:hypothetical protein n=1 Tax=Saccharopolyspora shandongensis TaxID=418495 RepID=UPI0033D3F781
MALSNSPASSVATASVSREQVGAASGIYAQVAMRSATGGEPPAESLAIGLSRASIALAAFSAAGVLLALLVARRPEKPRLGDYAAATTATTHTLPTA